MEPRRKSKEVDFFSDLPDNIFHKIISSFDIKDVARISTLSRRCRKNCLSTPFLNININNIRDDKNFYRFSAFLQRFMLFRNGINGMHKFEVEMLGENLDDDVGFHIGNWLIEASRFNVEKICLSLEGFRMFTLPSSVLNSACLRDLEVNLSCAGLLNLPNYSFGSLENLTLGHLLVSIEFGEWISSCKSLKKIYLYAVSDKEGINISSSSLEELILENIYGHTTRDFNIKISAERLKNLHMIWPIGGVFVQSLMLHAPKLEQFIWDGYASRFNCEGDLDSLCSAYISVEFAPTQKEALDNGIIGKVLRSMHRVSSMSIHVDSIMEISSRVLLPEFCNLRSLTLTRRNFSQEIPSTVSLLSSMPHLNTLKMQKVKKKYVSAFGNEIIHYDAEYWESQNLKFVNSLKEFEMKISGEQNEMELIKYLLKNAKALKTMTIHYPSDLQNRQCLNRKIQQFQIASSSIAIFFDV